MGNLGNDGFLQTYNVAIIGGGFTGTIFAAQLLRQSNQQPSVVVVDKSNLPGRGLAYRTQCEQHLLNVPASNMSAWADDPEHFLRWAKSNCVNAVFPGSFLPRKLYGRYVESVLRDSIAFHRGRLEWKQADVYGIASSDDGKWQLLLRGGSKIIAENVVFAMGNYPPRDLDLPGRRDSNSRPVAQAWSAAAVEHSDSAGGVLLIGCGLTGVDLAIQLRASQFRGEIHFLSRRGLLPNLHSSGLRWPTFWDQHSPKTTLGLFRLVRDQVRRAKSQGVTWHSVIDSLRSSTQQIWRSLPEAEKRRFLRHLRPYWEVHRHRMAPEIAEVLRLGKPNREIQIHAGGILEYRENADGIAITYKRP